MSSPFSFPRNPCSQEYYGHSLLGYYTRLSQLEENPEAMKLFADQRWHLIGASPGWLVEHA
jgi:hypothetical protein